MAVEGESHGADYVCMAEDSEEERRHPVFFAASHQQQDSAAAAAAALHYSRRGWSARIDELTARLDVLGSLFFLIGSVLFYPSLEDSCAAQAPCLRVGAALFVLGSALFWVGASVALQRARRARARAARGKQSPGAEASNVGAYVDALLSFAADGAFTIGSVYFLPCVWRVSAPCNLYLALTRQVRLALSCACSCHLSCQQLRRGCRHRPPRRVVLHAWVSGAMSSAAQRPPQPRAMPAFLRYRLSLLPRVMLLLYPHAQPPPPRLFFFVCAAIILQVVRVLGAASACDSQRVGG